MLSRKQVEIFRFLEEHEFEYPPTHIELAKAMGLNSGGSMHKQVQALIKEGLVKPMKGWRTGIQLTGQTWGLK